MTEREEIKRRLLKLAMLEEARNSKAWSPKFQPGTKWFERVFEASRNHGFGCSVLTLALDLAVDELVQLHALHESDMSPVHEDEPDDREWEEQADD